MEVLDEVTAQIGQGGMRRVSRARDLKPKRTVARRQLPVPFRAMVRVTAILLLTGIVASTKAVAQQPAFAPGSGPTVLFDLGHNSLFLGEPNLSPMTRLQDDGYLTQTLTGPFTEEALAGVDIVIVAAPLADRNAIRRPADCSPPPDMSAECFEARLEAINAQIREVWRHPIPSAFSVEEIDTLQAWVERGGGLFLVFDIFPFPGAIEALAGRFGVEVSNGFAVDERLLPALSRETRPPLGQAGQLVFRRVDQTLAEHPVTNGRSSAERVDAVASIVGSAFRLPLGGQSLLTFGPSSVSLLPEVAWEFSEARPRQPIDGWSQGGLLRVGEGRLAIFGESGILAHGPRFDERHPEVQNSQLVLNVVHWLSGLLDEPQ